MYWIVKYLAPFPGRYLGLRLQRYWTEFVGLLRVFTGLGFIVGPVIGGGLYSLGGFRLPLFVTGISLLAALPFVWLFLPRKDANHVDRPSQRKPSLRRALTIPSVAVISLWYLVGIIAISYIEPILQPYAETLGINSTGVGLLFLATSGAYLICTPIIGYVLDRKPLRRTFIIFGAFGISICLMFFGPAPFLSSFIPRKVWMLTLSLAVSGAAFSFGLVPVLPELLKCCYERGFPKDILTDSLISGIYTGVANLGAFFGPAVGGILTGAVGFPWTSTIMGFAVLFKALLLLIFFIFTRRNNSDHNTLHRDGRLQYSESFETLNVSYRSSATVSLGHLSQRSDSLL